MTGWTWLMFAAGLALLVTGADLLVRGASRLAALLGVSPLVIGLTVVAIGTSTPEFAVSAFSGISGQAALACGNAVGSNLFNILIILGLTAMVSPVAIHPQVLRRDLPVTAGVTALVLLMALDMNLGWIDGVVLLSGMVTYTAILVRAERISRQGHNDRPAGSPAGEAPPAGRWRKISISILNIVIGLVLLVAGASLLVESAVSMARAFGLSEWVIGLTIVAGGTSLPEVATSLVAAWRRQSDLAVGNVLGSNFFNLTLVLGFAAAISPGGLPVSAAAQRLDLPVMLGATLILFPMFLSGRRVSRAEGALLVSYYAGFLIFQMCVPGEVGWVPAGVRIGLLGVLPLAILSLAGPLSRLRWFRRAG